MSWPCLFMNPISGDVCLDRDNFGPLNVEMTGYFLNRVDMICEPIYIAKWCIHVACPAIKVNNNEINSDVCQ